MAGARSLPNPWPGARLSLGSRTPRPVPARDAVWTPLALPPARESLSVGAPGRLVGKASSTREVFASAFRPCRFRTP
jgi:hypothetical protein